jgi:hypothetical protein
MLFFNVTTVGIQLPLDIERVHQGPARTYSRYFIHLIYVRFQTSVVNFNLYFALLDCKGESSHQNKKKNSVIFTGV